MDSYNYVSEETSNLKRSEGMAEASLILGIIGLIFVAIPLLDSCLSGLAMLFANLSRGGNMKYRGKSLAGNITGIIGLVISIIVTIYYAIIFIMGFDDIMNILNSFFSDSIGSFM